MQKAGFLTPWLYYSSSYYPICFIANTLSIHAKSHTEIKSNRNFGPSSNPNPRMIKHPTYHKLTAFIFFYDFLTFDNDFVCLGNMNDACVGRYR